ncbi:MAG: hypothetical protein R3Y43_02965 [Alphaproteobacteria bacterium]
MHFNKAIIIFEDNTTLWYLRLLKENFRHCYVVLFSDKSHICTEINPMSNKILINNFHKLGLKSYLKNKSFIVVDCTYIPLKALPIGVFSCVEVLKRIVGINKRFLITPHQLYTYLQKIGKNSLTFQKKYFTSTISQRH